MSNPLRVISKIQKVRLRKLGATVTDDIVEATEEQLWRVPILRRAGIHDHGDRMMSTESNRIMLLKRLATLGVLDRDALVDFDLTKEEEPDVEDGGQKSGGVEQAGSSPQPH